MNRQHSGVLYVTTLVRNDQEGCVGYELLQIQDSRPTRIARILYWDACGQFYLETWGKGVPLGILEELIAEAKSIPGTG